MGSENQKQKAAFSRVASCPLMFFARVRGFGVFVNQGVENYKSGKSLAFINRFSIKRVVIGLPLIAYESNLKEVKFHDYSAWTFRKSECP